MRMETQDEQPLSWEVAFGYFSRLTNYASSGSIYSQYASFGDCINVSWNWPNSSVPAYASLKSYVLFPDDLTPDWPGNYSAAYDVAFHDIYYYPADFQERYRGGSPPYPPLNEDWVKYKIRLKISTPVAAETRQTCLVVRREWATYAGGSGSYVDTVIDTHTL